MLQFVRMSYAISFLLEMLACAAELRFRMFSADFVLRMQVAEYIDLLQLDVARNKKYRMDAEDWEPVSVVVTGLASTPFA